MKQLLFVCGVIFATTVVHAKPMAFSECVDQIYTGAGARSMEEAKITCRIQNDADFVQCAVDKYNDLDYSYSSDEAINSCLDRFPRQSIHTSCVTILQSSSFDRMSAIDLCDELTETSSLAIPKCIYYHRNSDSDTIVEDCKYAFNHGQLNGEGQNKEEIARQKRAEAAARQAALQKQAEIQRKQEEARRRQAEAEMRRKQETKIAEQNRRKEEQRLWDQMLREEQARQEQQARQEAKKPIPREEVPPKKNQRVSPVEKPKAIIIDKPAIEDQKQKTDEGKARVEKAKQEAEARRKQLENEKKKKQGKDSKKENTDSSGGDVPPPPADGLTDFPNPYE